jgi:hypothetical protein
MPMPSTVMTPKIKHILVATDLSPASFWSLPYVIEISLQYGSIVYVGQVS